MKAIHSVERNAVVPWNDCSVGRIAAKGGGRARHVPEQHCCNVAEEFTHGALKCSLQPELNGGGAVAELPSIRTELYEQLFQSMNMKTNEISRPVL